MNRKYLVALSVFMVSTSWCMAPEEMINFASYEVRSQVQAVYNEVEIAIKRLAQSNTLNVENLAQAIEKQVSVYETRDATTNAQSKNVRRQYQQLYCPCFSFSLPGSQIVRYDWNGAITQVAVLEKKDETTSVLSVWQEMPDIFQDLQLHLGGLKKCTSIVNDGGLCKIWAKRHIKEFQIPIVYIRFMDNDTKLLLLSPHKKGYTPAEAFNSGRTLDFFMDNDTELLLLLPLDKGYKPYVPYVFDVLTGAECDNVLQETIGAAIDNRFKTSQKDGRQVDGELKIGHFNGEKEIAISQSEITIEDTPSLQDIATYLIKNAQGVEKPNAYESVVKKQKKNELVENELENQ